MFTPEEKAFLIQILSQVSVNVLEDRAEATVSVAKSILAKLNPENNLKKVDNVS